METRLMGIVIVPIDVVWASSKEVIEPQQIYLKNLFPLLAFLICVTFLIRMSSFLAGYYVVWRWPYSGYS